MSKNKFVIAPHMRLHEWVAEENGYFEDETCDLRSDFPGKLNTYRGPTPIYIRSL